jgi:uncharacterized protein (DUF1330 family)
VEETVNQRIALGLAMLAGAAFGAVAVNGLHAQGKAGAYAIVDITAVNNPDTFKTLFPIAQKALDATGGKYVIRTENITALDGTPPKRFVVVAFDSMDKAKAWHTSAETKQVDEIRAKSTNSRSFLVEGFSN